jgi:hypothetical protein
MFNGRNAKIFLFHVISLRVHNTNFSLFRQVANMTRQECLGFTVLPQQVFYVITYPAWRLLFNPSQSKEAMEKVVDSYGVHVWNKMSSQENVTVGSEQAYGLLAAAYCPRVYSNCGPIF